MPDRTGHLMAPSRTYASRVCAALWMLVMGAGAAWPQAAPPPLGVQTPAQQAVPDPARQGEPASPPAQDENPGLINEIGKLWEKSTSILPTLKSPQDTIEEFNTRA
jgi:hypothetical protein